jgi:hypothetical protein
MSVPSPCKIELADAMENAADDDGDLALVRFLAHTV